MSEENNDLQASASRPKRQSSAKEKKRALLEKMRDTLKSGKKNKYDIGELESVYEEVDEREYTRKVLERQEDDWIVDDDGCGYIEDGREIFDDDLDEESINRSKGTSSKKRSRSSIENSDGVRKGNIRNMIVNMPTKKKKESHISLEEDDILGDIIGELDTTSTKSSRELFPAKKEVNEMSAKDYLKSFSTFKTKPKQSQPLAENKNEINLKSNNVKNWNVSEKKIETPPVVPKQSEPAIVLDESIKIKEEPVEIVEANEPAEEPMEFETLDFEIPSIDEIKIEKVEMKQETFQSNGAVVEKVVKSSEPAEEDAADSWDAPDEKNVNECINVDLSSLPMTKNDDGEEVLRFFYLDAHEEIFTQPGTVYLFGKVWIENAKTFVSCCITVKNIDRQIFILPREKRVDLKMGEEYGEPITMADVYEEFNSVICSKYKIKEFRSRNITKKYSFDKRDVPIESEYLEVRYPASIGPLPSDLKGETFSHVFGTRSSFLELLLLDRGLKGPSWVDVSHPKPVTNPCSWCKIEAECIKSTSLRVLKNSSAMEIPPLVMLVIQPQALYNIKSKQNEIVSIGCLINSSFPIQKPPPKRLFSQHFCVLSKPSNMAWPFDWKEELYKFKKTTLHKMDSERALLNFFLTRLFRIDPDIIVGHDLSGYSIGLFVDRMAFHKIPNWSRFGRLRRSQMPHNKNKSQIERIALTGRLLCDIKISAKELIRSRSYDLSTLCQNVLHFEEDKRPDMTEDDFRCSYSSGSCLINAVWNLMSDASYIIRILAELNVIPLALQITNIAGNVLSRTLLGGRSERNEFLLLHAFHNNGYIVPDKEYKKVAKKDEDEHEDAPKKGPSKKKPSYAGGLVLDPKVGFYDDHLILLMDFNSLYPSIIQEYNICFTTVSITSFPTGDELPEDIKKFLPDDTVKPGILPTEIRKLVESRRNVKRLLKSQNLSPELRLQYDIRQMALKLTANSMYGCLGFSHSRFYAKPLAAIVTARGREILLNTKKMVESFGYEVIYGDTDSLMINTKSNKFEDVHDVGRKIKSEVNKCYKQVELDIDGVFKYMLLLKKKKYAAVTVSKLPNGTLVEKKEVKGLDMVRRDWCQLSAETGNFVLNQILSNLSADDKVEAIHTYLENIRQDLESGKVPLSLLTVTKQLTKAPEEYADKKALPHVQVALRMNALTSKRLKQGDTVSYIVCEDGTNNAATQRAYHAEELKAKDSLKIDINYYLSQQIHPVIARLCEPIDGVDAVSLARCLGLDPSVYSRRNLSGINDCEDLEGLFGMKDDERFKDCSRFSFTCKNPQCNTENVIEGPTRKNAKGLEEMVLERCQNPECLLAPIDYLQHIQNMLQISMREHIRKHYEGWLLCEDPVCNHRTTEINPIFEGAYPVCQKCENSVMHREYTSKDLYNQLCFFSHVFDLSKLAKRASKFEPTTKSAYEKVQEQVKRVLSLNKYSVIDLSKIFGPIFPPCK